MKILFSFLLFSLPSSVSVQIANETNLFAEESEAVRIKNGGGSGWYGSDFSKFPAQLSFF